MSLFGKREPTGWKLIVFPGTERVSICHRVICLCGTIPQTAQRSHQVGSTWTPLYHVSDRCRPRGCKEEAERTALEFILHESGRQSKQSLYRVASGAGGEGEALTRQDTPC